MKSVAIIHPWLPQYRVHFFEALTRELSHNQIRLRVFYGDTPKEWIARNDASSTPSATRLPTRFFRIGHRNISYKSLVRYRDEAPYDLVILEQAIRNLESYKIIASLPSTTRLAYWGHGKTYTQKKSDIEEKIKIWLTKRSSWFFGYTKGGVSSMIERGYDPERTTVVQNSIDTEGLKSLLQAVGPDELMAFKEQHSLTNSTYVYIGGIDEAKRIDFLLAAADIIAKKDREFRLIMIGAGSSADIVRRKADSSSYLVYLGAAFGTAKALALKSSIGMMNPGRVGLIAVDSLTAGVPLITTNWPYHAPEFEYLQNGYTCIVSNDSLTDFSDEISAFSMDRARQTAIAANCRRESEAFSTSAMVSRFAEGIRYALSSKKNGD